VTLRPLLAKGLPFSSEASQRTDDPQPSESAVELQRPPRARREQHPPLAPAGWISSGMGDGGARSLCWLLSLGCGTSELRATEGLGPALISTQEEHGHHIERPTGSAPPVGR